MLKLFNYGWRRSNPRRRKYGNGIRDWSLVERLGILLGAFRLAEIAGVDGVRVLPETAFRDAFFRRQQTRRRFLVGSVAAFRFVGTLGSGYHLLCGLRSLPPPEYPMHKKRAQFPLFCTHPKPCYRHSQIHEEKMRPYGRTSTYMPFDV